MGSNPTRSAIHPGNLSLFPDGLFVGWKTGRVSSSFEHQPTRLRTCEDISLEVGSEASEADDAGQVGGVGDAGKSWPTFPVNARKLMGASQGFDERGVRLR